MIEVRHGRLDRNEEKTVARVEALFSRPEAVVAQRSQRGLISKNKLRAFAEGRWMELWRECVTNEENAREIRSRRGRTHPSDSLGKERDLCLVLSLSWVSCPRHALRWREPLAHQGMPTACGEDSGPKTEQPPSQTDQVVSALLMQSRLSRRPTPAQQCGRYLSGDKPSSHRGNLRRVGKRFVGSRGHPHQLGQDAAVQQGRFPATWLPTHPPSGQGDDSSRDRVAWRPHSQITSKGLLC